jgi:hypothetical protein
MRSFAIAPAGTLCPSMLLYAPPSMLLNSYRGGVAASGGEVVCPPGAPPL